MRRIHLLLTALLVASLTLAACGGKNDKPATTSDADKNNTPPAATQPAKTEKKTVTVLGQFTGPEESQFNQTIADFEKANPDIDVVYTGANDFATLIEVKVQGNDTPDIAMFPQPGGAARMAKEGKLAPLWPEVLANIDKNYEKVWKELGTFEGKPYGLFHRVNAKGWIWYNKPAFEKAGYKAPTTWDELMKLVETMKSTGTAPFCEGIGAGDATGWKGTDWIESIMLRTQSPANYDKWVAGELKFSSPEVKNAFNKLGQIWLDPKAVYGGQKTIATVAVADSAKGLHANPPQCWLHFQGSFVTSFFTENVQKELDKNVGVFIMPPIDPKVEPGLAVGGDVFVTFKGKDRPEVKKFMEWLTTVDSTVTWAKQGGSLFPHKGQDLNNYKTEIERTMAKTITTAKAARFDGSDAMKAELNRAFWVGITNWVSGTSNLDTALKEIDAAGK
ncbi:MAG: extracellular solute-binding protein family 1 [Symbiobacteriaceae bacterium]|nr:extracellular solute-binding protein family 1 [Symbiobacteriaceae bacterium]